MSRCDRCGGKDHATMGHDAWAADVLASQQADSLRAGGLDVDDAELTAAELAAGFDHRSAMRRFGQRMPESLDVEALLTFEPEANYSPRVLVGRPQKPFLPRGLMLWDVAGMNLRAALIGTNNELVVAFGLVPAEWFATSQSFEQVVKAHAEGNEPARGWGHWTTAHPGMLVRLVFDEPVVRAAHVTVRALMWGHSS